jgi:O-methyltransferase involved in polyketide biosynthesis
VGRFSDPVARELLDPAERIVVDRVRAAEVPTRTGDRMVYEMVRRTGLTLVPRTIAIDAAIHDHAAGQLVLLGAGLRSSGGHDVGVRGGGPLPGR